MSGAVPRAAAWAGAVRISPLIIVAFPFGLIYGVTATDNGIAEGPAILASALILAGASQIALVDLIGDDAAWYVAVGTALVINLRMALYSANLARPFSEFSLPWRLGLSHLIIDQTAVTASLEYEDHTDPLYRRWFFFGAAAAITPVWMIGSTVGVLVGGEIPDWVELPFAVPLMFLAILVPALRNRPTVVATLVGGGVCVATLALPNGLNLVVGALAGVVAGVLVSGSPAARTPHAEVGS